MLLVMCECSQEVASAFRSRGVEAYSCDLQPCYGGHPEYHLQMDCFEAFNRLHPDMVIAHPPCTYLTNAGSKYFLPDCPGSYERWYHRMDAIGFFYRIWCLPVRFLCVENPVGVLSRAFRSPDQVVHPWMFGDNIAKRTCLWLRGLPNLVVSNSHGELQPFLDRLIFGASRADSRSHTSSFLAAQMALQWEEFAYGSM